MEERQDPHTGEWFIPKRRNQIYASRKNQTGFNNEKSRKNRELVNPVNKKLLKNRNILHDLLGIEDEREVSKDLLVGKGFHFDVITARKNIAEKPYFLYYDMALNLINNGKFLIKHI